jgi:hypothetical protein
MQREGGSKEKERGKEGGLMRMRRGRREEAEE